MVPVIHICKDCGRHLGFFDYFMEGDDFDYEAGVGNWKFENYQLTVDVYCEDSVGGCL